MACDRNLEVVVDTPELGIATSGRLFVVRFRTVLNRGVMRDLEAAHRACRAESETALEMLTIIDPGHPLPTYEVKIETAKTFRRLAVGNACSATVVTGEGYWANAARSTLTALTLLAQPACPSKAFSDLEGAFRWMETTFEGDPRRWSKIAAAIEAWAVAPE